MEIIVKRFTMNQPYARITELTKLWFLQFLSPMGFFYVGQKKRSYTERKKVG